VEACRTSANKLFVAHNDAVAFFAVTLPTTRSDNPECEAALDRTWQVLKTGSDKWQNREFFDATDSFQLALSEFQATYDESTCDLNSAANTLMDLQESAQSTIRDCADISRSDSDQIVEEWYTDKGVLYIPTEDTFQERSELDGFSQADAQEGFWVVTRLGAYLDAAQEQVDFGTISSYLPFDARGKALDVAYATRRNTRALKVVKSLMKENSVDLTSPMALLQLLQRIH
jgi:hypothetical protein